MDDTILEKFPSKPNEVILQNEFYPNGLTHHDVYSYYQMNKPTILKNTHNHAVMMFFAPTANHIIVKRKIDNSFIRLNQNNYNDLISGRSISIHSTMNLTESFGIIDVDGDNFEDNKSATFTIYNKLIHLPIFKSIKIIYTGKTSFHIRPIFHKSMHITKIKEILIETLQSLDLPWSISYKRLPGKVVLDLSSNKFQGGFITVGSLSVLGLKCLELEISELMGFQKELAKITIKRNLNEHINILLETIVEHTLHNTVNMQHCIGNIERFLKFCKTNPIYWSYKIDGARCWIIVNKRTIPHGGGFKKIADIVYLSRSNNIFGNLHIFDNDIIELCHHLNRTLGLKYPIIFDSEVTGPNKNLEELLTQLRRKTSVQHSMFKLHVFDLAVNLPYEKRQDLLKDSFTNCSNKSLQLVESHLLTKTSIDEIENVKNKAIKLGYEGIMLTDGKSTYQFGKTTNSCCKVKKFNTIDLKIIGIIPGAIGTKFENMLAAFICDFNGKNLQISGKLTNEMRKEFFKNPPIGQYLEVKYSSITRDGKLRDPVFLRMRPDLKEG